MISNALGLAILNGTVTPATFAGLPVVVCGGNLTSTSDARWTAALQVETVRYAGVPMIGLDTNGSAAQLTLLTYAVNLLSNFLAPGSRPLVYADDSRTIGLPPVCGPILCLPSSSPTYTDEVAAAKVLSRNFVGTRLGNAVSYGGLALGPLSTLAFPSVSGTIGNVWEKPYAPPVYRTNYPSTGVSYAADVESIVTLWKGGAISTVAQIAQLQTLDLVYPGISRRVAPFLVDWLAV